MATRSATITVDADLAQAYNAAPRTTRKKLQSVLRRALRESSTGFEINYNPVNPPANTNQRARHVSGTAFDLGREAEATRRVRKESELLLKINLGLPADLKRRFDELNDQRRAGSLTRQEHAELLEMIDEVEAERVGYLAKLRGRSLPALMKGL